MPDRRFLVSADSISIDGEPIALIEGPEHNHLRRVLRLKPGDEVSVFDGLGRGYLGRLEAVDKDRSRVRLTAPDERRVEPSLQVVLAQGIPHHDKMDFVVQKTTELGVARIVPLVTERTVLRPSKGDRWGRLDRWRRIAAEAARQSGRLVVPRVEEPVTWGELLAQAEAGPVGRGFLLGPPVREASGEADVEPLHIPQGTPSALLAVGPEGGWSGQEADAGRAAGLVWVGLGPRVLRAETAGVVAVALALFVAGDLGAGGS